MTMNRSPNENSAKDADDQWARWVAKGVAQDRRTHTRVMVVTSVVASGLAVWLTSLLLLG